MTKSLLILLFTLLIGTVYYSYKILLYYPYTLAGDSLSRLATATSGSTGTAWGWLKRSATMLGHGLVAAAYFIAWQALCFVETVITVIKALIWALCVAVAFPFVGLYRLSSMGLERLRSFSASGAWEVAGGAAKKSSSLVIGLFRDLFSFMAFVLLSCAYYLLWCPLRILGEYTAGFFDAAWTKSKGALGYVKNGAVISGDFLSAAKRLSINGVYFFVG